MANKKLHVKTNDTVFVLTGKDKGKQGKVLRANPEAGRVIVEGVNIVTKHQKPRGAGMQGGIVKMEAAINASNVLPVCAKCSKPTRVGHKIVDGGRKARVCKKCGAEFDN